MKEIPARWVGETESREVAPNRLSFPGDMLLVRRSGTDRWFIMRCPCGCGDDVPVNLDPRTGPAWRLYKPGRRATLYPSVWRDNGCRSHYIVHHGMIWLFTRVAGDWGEHSIDGSVVQAIEVVLTDRYVHFTHIADLSMQEPWDAYLACEQLRATGAAECGTGKLQQHYRRLRLRTE